MIDGITDVTQASKIVESLYILLKTPVVVAEQSITISTSIGISLYPQDGLDIHTLLKQADTALYRVKASGKNHAQFYTLDLNQKVQIVLSRSPYF